MVCFSGGAGGRGQMTGRGAARGGARGRGASATPSMGPPAAQSYGADSYNYVRIRCLPSAVIDR